MISFHLSALLGAYTNNAAERLPAAEIRTTGWSRSISPHPTRMISLALRGLSVYLYFLQCIDSWDVHYYRMLSARSPGYAFRLFLSILSPAKLNLWVPSGRTEKDNGRMQLARLFSLFSGLDIFQRRKNELPWICCLRCVCLHILILSYHGTVASIRF